MDVEKHEVLKDGICLAFTPREFDVLVYFLQHTDVIIRKETLMAAVWGYDFMGGLKNGAEERNYQFTEGLQKYR